jgi:Holliday junction resolvase-like predicted endonuclease
MTPTANIDHPQFLRPPLNAYFNAPGAGNSSGGGGYGGGGSGSTGGSPTTGSVGNPNVVNVRFDPTVSNVIDAGIEIAGQSYEIGKFGEAKAIEEVRKYGWEIVGTQVRVTTSEGTLRVIDVLARKPTGELVNVEVKASNIGAAAYYGSGQYNKDRSIYQNGGTLVNPVGGLNPAGSKIFPEPFQIYVYGRPPGT